MRIKALVLITLALLFFRPSFAQPVFFERTFGGTGSDISETLRQLGDGSIFIVGHSDSGGSGSADIVLVKLDKFGNTKWVKYFGGTYNDYGLGMEVLSDGNLAIVGETNTASSGIDAILLKVDTAGNELWRKIFSTPVNESVRSVTETPDGGFILCGFQNDSFNSNDTYVIKLDSAGNLQWQNTYGGTSNDYGNRVFNISGGGYILTADTKSFGAGGYDVELIKLDSQGTAVWDSTYGDQYENGCQGMIITADGKYLSFGETEIYSGSPYHYFMHLIDTNGATIWKKVFGGLGTDAVFEVVETPSGDFVCTGYSNSNSNGQQPLDLVVFRTDSAGTVQWSRLYGTPFIDIGYDIVASIDNGYLITGKTFAEDDQFYLLHVDQQGIVGIPSIEASVSPVHAFPNPSNGSFYLTLPSALTSYKISVYSPEGKLVRYLETNTVNTVIELGEHFVRGIYTAEITDEHNRWHIKLALY